jgi:hypothetical protein
MTQGGYADNHVREFALRISVVPYRRRTVDTAFCLLTFDVAEVTFMRASQLLVLAAIAGSGFMAFVPKTEAGVTVDIGLAPECPYGYYDAAPYGCAPSGYYGPEWFSGNVFIGAGPWFHGPSSFRGNVNNSYHPEHGYKGALPNRGEKAEDTKRVDKAHFTVNEERDGRGHATEGKR